MIANINSSLFRDLRPRLLLSNATIATDTIDHYIDAFLLMMMIEAIISLILMKWYDATARIDDRSHARGISRWFNWK